MRSKTAKRSLYAGFSQLEETQPSASMQPQHLKSLAPVYAENVSDLHACRIPTDAQGQVCVEIPGESGEMADVSFVDACG